MDTLGDFLFYKRNGPQRPKSHRNGILAVVLPDQNGSYDYAMTSNNCCSSTCITYHNVGMFTVIKENMFNRKIP